jgi:putative transposase
LEGQVQQSHGHEEWVWQSHSFHHRLRRDEDYSQKWLYAQENPVRAGLAAEIGQWPYQGTIHEMRW